MTARATKILHLEDDDLIAHLVALTVERHCIQFQVDNVATRESFEKALATEPYGLVLSDAYLPGFDGRSALEFVRTHHLHIPFIFLTGSVNEADACAALDAGALDYLTKDDLWRLPIVIANVLSPPATMQSAAGVTHIGMNRRGPTRLDYLISPFLDPKYHRLR